MSSARPMRIMSIRHLLVKEIAFRKSSFALALASMAVAAGCLAGTVSLLRAHDLRTAAMVETKLAQTRQLVQQRQAEADKQAAALEEAYRKIMLKFGYNLAILPADQNVVDYQLQGSPSKEMDEDRVRILSESGILTVRHLLPVLQQRQIVIAGDRRQEVFLIGTRGEVPIGTDAGDEKRPLQPAVGEGQIIVGADVRRELGLEVGHTVKVIDAEFTVSKSYEPRGTSDDSSVWIDLKQAQRLLGKPGKINGILALSCLCKPQELDGIKNEIVSILPGTQVRVMTNSAVIRYEARARAAEEAQALVGQAQRQAKDDLEREMQHAGRVRGQIEALVAWIVPLALVVCAAWTALLAVANLRERRSEIGILRALGLRSRQIFTLFLSKALVVGALGACAGYVAGVMTAALWQRTIAWRQLFDPSLLAVVLVLGPVVSVVACWVPAMLAARQDPAAILQEQ